MLYRSFISLLGIAVVSVLFFGSAPSAKAARLYTNTNPLFEACVQRCEEQTPLGALTKRGCYKGCAEIRRVADIPESYRSMASCIEDMNELELVKDLVIEKHQTWCDRQTTHIHKRKGCRDAMEVYMRAATVNSICYNQQPKAIAKQTPRTSLTTPYPAPTTYQHSSAGYSSQPAPSYGGSYAMPQGNALSMPPVYDTPKYSPAPAPKASQKRVQPAKRAKPVATAPKGSPVKPALKAPSLAPPKQVATPKPAPTTQKAVPVITPSTAIMPATTTSGASPTPAPTTTPLAAQAPSTPRTSETISATTGAEAAKTSGVTASAPVPAPTQASAQAPAQAPAPIPLAPPAPEPVVNTASAPTVPPVIAPPAAIMPDFSTAPPARPAPSAVRTMPSSPPQGTGQSPRQTPGQGPDLLPRLQQSASQTAGQAGTPSTGGIDSPMPQPIPAPAT